MQPFYFVVRTYLRLLVIAGLILALSGNFGTWALLRARYRSFNDRTAGGQVESAFDGPWPGAAFLFLVLSGNFGNWALFRAVDLRGRLFFYSDVLQSTTV